MKKQFGFTAIELLIILLIIGILATAAIVNIPAVFSTYDVELVTTQVADLVSAARRAALTGNPDLLARSFDIKNAVTGKHGGILITTTAGNGLPGGCRRGCDPGTPSLCVSNESFCYLVSNSFEFERFSGEEINRQQHVIFIISARRQFAILVRDNGDINIVEAINGNWIARNNLQGTVKS